jgi:hypothetical protein
MAKKIFIAALVALLITVAVYAYIKHQGPKVPEVPAPDSPEKPQAPGVNGSPSPAPTPAKPADPSERKKMAETFMKRWRANNKLNWLFIQDITPALCERTVSGYIPTGETHHFAKNDTLTMTGRNPWKPENVNKDGFIIFSQPNAVGHVYYIVVSPWSVTLF